MKIRHAVLLKFERLLLATVILWTTAAGPLVASTIPPPMHDRSEKPAISLKLIVAEASVSFDQRTDPPKPFIFIKLETRSAADFARFTRGQLSAVIEVLIDGRVIFAPQVREPISGGILGLHGEFSRDEATEIARRLNAQEAELTVRPLRR